MNQNINKQVFLIGDKLNEFAQLRSALLDVTNAKIGRQCRECNLFFTGFADRHFLITEMTGA